MVVRPPETDSSPPSRGGFTAQSVKIRLEDPVSRFFRYPLARWIVRGLVRTSITPNQVTLVQPFLAAVAAWLIVSEERWRLLLAVAIFEIRSILDCVDGTLARAKNLSSPAGHAIDGLADWLSVLFLYAGIALHFQAHPPLHDPSRAAFIAPGVLAAALLQGAMRSFASDYYKQKYVSIFARGRDATVESLREKALALGPESGVFARAEVLIGRIGHLVFERAWLDPHGSGTAATEEQVRELRRQARSPLTRLILGLWSVSNGDAFVTLVCLSAVFGKLWEGQVFFASIGPLWIGCVIALNGWFVRSAARRGGLTTAAAR
jgi:phosphatidylglycerophosphate synthase